MSHEYMSSLPAPDNAAPDRHIHRNARRLLRYETLSNYELHELKESLTYRLKLNQLATEYKCFLKVDYPDCNHWDFESWFRSATSGPSTVASTYPEYLSLSSFAAMIYEAGLFDPPTEDQGWDYNKPERYLAAACVDSGLSKEAIESAIANMVAYKQARAQA